MSENNAESGWGSIISFVVVAALIGGILIGVHVNNNATVSELEARGQEATATYDSKRLVRTGKYSRGYKFTYTFNVNSKPYTVTERGKLWDRVPKGTEKTVCYNSEDPTQARLDFDGCGKNQ